MPPPITPIGESQSAGLVLAGGTPLETAQTLGLVTASGAPIGTSQPTGLALIPPSFGASNVDTAEALSSLVFTDLATPGPTVTLQTGTDVVVWISAVAQRNALCQSCYMGVEVSGASAIPASDVLASEISQKGVANFQLQFGRCFLQSGLTPGANTFTAKYHDDGGAFTYSNRSIAVATAEASANIVTAESTASMVYTDLATVGPSISVVTGTTALIWFSSSVFRDVPGNTAWVSVEVSGATVIAASDNAALVVSNGYGQLCAPACQLPLVGCMLFTGLTPGLNTFTMQYRIDGGGAFTFNHRSIAWISNGLQAVTVGNPPGDSTASVAYTTLATPEAVTVTVGASGSVLVWMNANAHGPVQTTFKSVALSGANVLVASDANGSIAGNAHGGDDSVQQWRVVRIDGLNPGVTTFTAQYRVDGGTAASFFNRSLAVLPF